MRFRAFLLKLIKEALLVHALEEPKGQRFSYSLFALVAYRLGSPYKTTQLLTVNNFPSYALSASDLDNVECRMP